MDALTELLALAVVSLALVILDTYFWVRTTLRLRDFDNEIQPRLGVIDMVAERFGVVGALEIPQEGLRAGVAQVSEVRRTKKGSPFVVINGKSRFISERQAKALASGAPVSTVLSLPSGPTAPVPMGGPASDPGGGVRPPPDGEVYFDYDGAAAHLSALTGQQVSVDQLRAFEAAHTLRQGAPSEGAPAPPAQAQGDPFGSLVEKLANGTMTGEDAGKAARELLFAKQTAANPTGAAYGGNGSSWG